MKRAVWLLLALLTSAVFAQQDPDIERGFKPGRSYESGANVDTVSLFNGTLNIAIPLGQQYVVGGTLSYGLSAHYATNTWDTGHHEIDRYPLEPLRFDYTFPWIHSEAGHGWIVTLGKIHKGSGTDDYWYVGPEGGQHHFYYTLHGSNPAEQPVADANGTYWVRYTRDGTYLRLKIYTNRYEVEFPNGHVHTFDTIGRITRMEDPFGNNVTVTYGTQAAGSPFPNSTVWSISDSVGRTHKVYFRPGTIYDHGVPGVDVPHEVVHRVDVAAFDDTTAQYVFTYENEANGFSQISRRCGRRNDPDMQVVNVPLLQSISLNGYLQYQMAYDKGDQVNCSHILFNGSPTGNITSLVLPTGGTIAWTYQKYLFPGTGAGVSYNAGIATRTVTNHDGKVLGGTSYALDSVPTTSIHYDVVRTVTETGASYQTRHYFGACRRIPSEGTCRSGGLYGYPVTTSKTLGDAYLSTQVLELNDTGSATVVRETYRKYEADYFLTNIRDGEFNQRLAYEKTVYEDNSWTARSFSGFDGLGHYRSVTTSGSWGRHETRTTFTNYNPNAGSYAVDENHVLTTQFTLPDVNSKWLLTTFDLERVSESRDDVAAVTSESSVCFDGSGFLTSRRTYKNYGQTPTATVNDLLSVFQRDAAGNLTTEQYAGGDKGSLAPTLFACNAILSGETYRIDHRYSNGMRARSYYTASGSSPLTFFILDRDIDKNTGLTSQSRKASTPKASGDSNHDGIATKYEFDLLGRLTDVLPQGTGRRARTKYTYTMNPPAVTVTEIAGNTTLRTATSDFDSLGRARTESRTMPAGTASRTTEYNQLGQKTAEYAWGATAPTRFEYDVFGRPTRVIAPYDPRTTPEDTSTRISYTGASKVERTVKVRTGNSGTQSDFTTATTTEEYDPLGRLWRVTEPAATVNGTRPLTEYTYDVAGRLADVCSNKVGSTCGQQRVFNYDNRGFLISEQHPEKGVSGSGVTNYAGYDARGHVGRRYEGTAGSFDVGFTYDRAERLTRVFRQSGDATLKRFAFGDSNAAGDWRNGQLVQAVRFNWLPDAGIVVKIVEDYAYAQVDGLVSGRTTWDVECLVSNGDCEDLLAGSKKREFVQSFDYDQLGAPTTLRYPDCVLPANCASGTAERVVQNTYSAGWLTGVTWNGAGAASALTYHPTGSVHRVTHGNQVVDTQDVDEAGRTLQLQTSNAKDGAACVAPTFTQQPQNQTILEGETAALSAQASGQEGSTVSYQWYRGFPSDTATPVTLPVTPAGTTTYWVRATNGCGSADSVAATITVCALPAISDHPDSRTITRGQAYRLSVTATGSAPLRYRWFTVNGQGTETEISGAVSAIYWVTPAAATVYRVKVENDCGEVTSLDASVHVVDPPTVPANVRATREGSAVRVTWSASSSVVDIIGYRIERLPDGRITTVTGPETTHLDNALLTAGNAYVYRVLAIDGNGARSSPGGPDLVTLLALDDDPVGAGVTVIKGVHVGQLRQAIDAVRRAANLPPKWTSHAAVTGSVLASHFVEMRDALNEGMAALQLAPVEFGASTPAGIGTEIKASHLQTLRGGVQ